MPIRGADDADRLLSALGERLRLTDSRYDLVVVGGSALLAMGLIDRSTRDVDVVAERDGTTIAPIVPLPDELVEAANAVARDFAIPGDWLNAGPAALLDFGMPDGFEERLQRRSYGEALSVSFPSRFDQIHLKLYATVDQGPGKHERDLRALTPTPAELIAAARWTRTHDPSEGYRAALLRALEAFGVTNADL